MGRRRATSPDDGSRAGGPVRTCVGCRRRDSDRHLLRVVADPGGHRLVPDPRRRLPGRGAWVHRDERCITTAVDRGAFARALRVTGAGLEGSADMLLAATVRPQEPVAGVAPARTGADERNGSHAMSTP